MNHPRRQRTGTRMLGRGCETRGTRLPAARRQDPIRTGLWPLRGDTPLVRARIPEAIRERNLEPVGVVQGYKKLTVRVGDAFIFSERRLREGRADPHVVTGLVCEGKATEPGTLKYVFYVNDGLRVSDGVWMAVEAVGSDQE
jgi:hypothetical protein